MAQDPADPTPEADRADETPLVRCRRCDNAFVCNDPELSGAVGCPVCGTTASLSREHIALVEQAARAQVRDGKYNRRFEARRSIQPRAMALLPETRRDCERIAKRLRRDAIGTCPYCLYDVSGVLSGDDPIQCPECGEETSRPINTLVWCQRANASSGPRKVVLFSGLVVGACFLIGLVVGEVFDSLYLVSNFVQVLMIFATVGLPIGVPFAMYSWLRVRNPIMNRGLVWIASVLAGLANLVVAILLMVLATALLPVL